MKTNNFYSDPVKVNLSVTDSSPEMSFMSTDEIFLQKVYDCINNNLSNPNFTNKILANYLCLSVSQLNRKLRSITKQSSGKLIRATRLDHAAKLLLHNTGNVSEIAYRVGYNDLAHFSRCFKKTFYCPPSKYKNRMENKRS